MFCWYYPSAATDASKKLLLIAAKYVFRVTQLFCQKNSRFSSDFDLTRNASVWLWYIHVKISKTTPRFISLAIKSILCFDTKIFMVNFSIVSRHRHYNHVVGTCGVAKKKTNFVWTWTSSCETGLWGKSSITCMQNKLVYAGVGERSPCIEISRCQVIELAMWVPPLCLLSCWQSLAIIGT